MQLAAWHWHLEVSSKCALKCPRCPRTELPGSLVNSELSLLFFQQHFTADFIKKYVEKITFCGDDGDPIYAGDFIDIVKHLKSVKPIKIEIVTNGSHRKLHWWQSLANHLDQNDHIHFSIDGWDQGSNEQYRINSDWNSIVNGISTIRNYCNVFMSWDAIAFKFNESKLDHMKSLAEKMGFDQFQLTLSTKFHKVYPIYPINDHLQPTDSLISNKQRFQRIITTFNKRRPSNIDKKISAELYKKSKPIADLIPLCGIGNKGLFINSQGYFFPCCWVANRYGHNNDWHSRAKELFDLNVRSLESVITDKIWLQEQEIFSTPECRAKCNISVMDTEYATQW